MVSSDINAFLKELKLNNNKTWFDEHRHEYDRVRELFFGSVQQMIHQISIVDPAFSNLQPKECVFRINRDVRFSKDKRPYKNTMSAYFNPGGKKASGAGYYVHVEPGNSFVAAGIWMPEAPELKRIRQEIDYNFENWKAIINSSEFLKIFSTSLQQNEKLVRPPKGYEAENHAIDYLKLKSFVISHAFSNDALGKKDFMKNFQNVIRAAVPYTTFLKVALT